VASVAGREKECLSAANMPEKQAVAGCCKEKMKDLPVSCFLAEKLLGGAARKAAKKKECL